MDGRSAGVEPALASGRAALAANSEALRLVGTSSRVTGVEVRRDGRTLVLSAPRIILAAGALLTAGLVASLVADRVRVPSLLLFLAVGIDPLLPF